MNNLKNLNDDLFNLIIDKLDGESLFNFMELKLIKNIEGTKRVDKFVNYCKYTDIIINIMFHTCDAATLGGNKLSN